MIKFEKYLVKNIILPLNIIELIIKVKVFTKKLRNDRNILIMKLCKIQLSLTIYKIYFLKSLFSFILLHFTTNHNRTMKSNSFLKRHLILPTPMIFFIF